VTVGVLEQECLRLNRTFITAQTKGRPFITLKWACSADGFIGAWNDDAPAPVAISTPLSLLRVHHLRTTHQAILVGHRTLLSDSPSLTVRHWVGRQPLRIVLGRVAEGELPAGFEAFADIDTMLASLHRRGIQSLLVEGGQQTLQSFIDLGLWDEAWEEVSDKPLGEGIPVPKMPVGVTRRCERAFGVSITHWENS
jgi:diaminohydroxyphosphoribosylaminopyrimidine deaminase/5-amino-6-(5-phosphoribosylamino)uracil reductase